MDKTLAFYCLVAITGDLNGYLCPDNPICLCSEGGLR